MFFFLCGYLPFYFKHPANFSSSSIASFALLLSRVGWGKISMVGQSESDIFVPELKAKGIYNSRIISFTFPIPMGQ